MEWDINKIKGGHFTTYHFFVFCLMKQFHTYNLLWALISSRKHSCVLMSTQDHSWVRCHGAVSAHECWWAHIATWRHAHVCSCALIIANCSMVPSSWVLMDAHECSMVIRNTHGCSWLVLSVHEWYWVLMSVHDCSLAALMRSHELGAMEQWALMRAQEQSWAWRHEALSAHQHSWVLIAP